MSYTYEILNNYANETSAKLLNDKMPKLGKVSRIPFICSCGKEDSKTFIRIKFSGVLCKECTEISRRNKRETTNLEKYNATCTLQATEIKKKAEETIMNNYGVTNVFNLKEMQDKIKENNIKKYGVNNPFAAPEIKQKIRNTMKEKYGVEHCMQIPEIREKAYNTNIIKYGVKYISQNGMIKEKIKTNNLIKYGTIHSITEASLLKQQNTNLQKYGVKYTFQSNNIKDKIYKTNIKRYGYKLPSQSQIIKNKISNTIYKKYGVKWAMQSKTIQLKRDNTNLNKYGVKYPLQNREIQARIENNAYKFKKYKCPSGAVRNIQGYEHFALDKLFNEIQLKEEDIITARSEIPVIKYIYNNEELYYYPDIYIKSLNKIIEVKSMWTFNTYREKNIAKWNATINYGYNFEVWVFNNKGTCDIITKFD